MQIHELNNYSGSLGDAYLAADNGSDTGKMKTTALTDPLNARIDNIIAGTAPSAAEIVDARLGADGVTYPSLGAAIRDQVTDLKSDLSISGVSKGVSFASAEDGFVNYNGDLMQDATFKHITLSAKKNEIIAFTGRGYLETTAMISTFENGSYIPKVLSEGSVVKRYEYKAESDSTIVLSYNGNYAHHASIIYQLSNLEDQINAINEIIDETGLYRQIDFSNEIAGFVNSSGDISQSAGFYHVEIAVKGNSKVVFNGRGYLTSVAMISIKNEGGYLPVVLSVDSTVREYTYTTDTDVTLVFSYNKNHDHYGYIESLLGGDKTVNTKLNLFSIFETFGACGDSLISGVIETSGGNMVTRYDLSWANQIAIICGNAYFHYSFGGANAKTWLQNYSESIESKDAYFVALGTNDYETLSLGTSADVGTQADTFYRYYGDIIALLKAKNPKAKIFVCSIYRNEGDRPSWNNAIKYFADNNANVYYLDFTDLTNTFGAYKNGSHFSAIGYKMIAVSVSEMLDTLIMKSFSEFRYVGT